MSKIKDILTQGGIVGRIAAFLVLVVWAMNLIGGTAYHFWASKTLMDAGLIHSGFGIYGFLNIVASAFAIPLVLWAWNTVNEKEIKEDEK